MRSSMGFKTMSKLIEKGKTWVKLSDAYQDSKVGPPSYADTVPVARAYIKAAPIGWFGEAIGRIRPRRKRPMMQSCSLLAEWAPDPTTRSAILVQNPAKLTAFLPTREETVR
jgi:D-galactarolactone isomerase